MQNFEISPNNQMQIAKLREKHVLKHNMRQQNAPVNWYYVILLKFEQFRPNKSFVKVKHR